MTLHPESQRLLDELAELDLPPISRMTVVEARQLLEAPVGPLHEVAEVCDDAFAGPAGAIRVRRYRPLVVGSEPVNLLVFFHGGGWVIGSIESHEDTCRRLANSCAAMVVSIDYRLAPESRFPAAVADCVAGLEWASSNVEQWGVTGITAVAGDSAGGNLAAVVAQRAQDSGLPDVDVQVLIYPVTDCDLDTESYLEFSEGFGLTRDSMAWFWQQYLAEQDATQAGASPLRADSLAGLPPAYVVTAEYDILRDEGNAYARRLEAAGVQVAWECVPGLLHGFMLHADEIAEARAVIQRIGQFVKSGGVPAISDC
ncbi:MAG: alpha/beta hydrolase [Planctomycetaceae bacterium]